MKSQRGQASLMMLAAVGALLAGAVLLTQTYIARKRAEGKSTKEAIRCLKRHLARRIWHLLQPPTPDQHTIKPLT